MEDHTIQREKIKKDLLKGPCSLTDCARYGCKDWRELNGVLNGLLDDDYIEEISIDYAMGGGRQRIGYPTYRMGDKWKAVLEADKGATDSKPDTPKRIKLM